MPVKKKTRKRSPRTQPGRKWKEVPTTALVPVDGETADEDPVTEVEEPEVTPEDEDIDEVMQQLPQEAKIELWIWDGKADDWGYVTRYPAHGFSIDTVSKEYGPGKYRMIIRGPVEGRMRIRGRKMFVIGGPAITPGGGGARQPDVLSTGLVDLIRLQSETMRANLNQPRENIGDIVRMIAEVMRPPERTTVDPFKQAIEIVQLLKEGGQKGTGVKDFMEILEMGVEMGGASGGEGDGLSVFGKSLAKLLDKMDTTAKPPAEAPAEPTQIPAQTEATRELKEFFETANVVLSKAATRNADLDFYAEWLADNVPNTLDPYFAEWFGDPGYPDVMLTVFPGVAPDWLRPLLLKVRALLTEGEGEPSADSATGEGAPGKGDIPTAPEGGRGDIPDTAGNVEAGE